ncbi:MAG: hypothetical protein JO244_08410 [Solirubrobacterales bacterium]|nr:hypothetical protein [Solirubrobacterales bacterium]
MRRILAVAGGLLLLVLVGLVIPQLVLPGIAAQRLRDRLSHSGRVLEVSVDAFPAIKLLWHRADRVVVRMASYQSNTSGLSRTLGQLRDVSSVDASVGRLQIGLLTLRDARLEKRGDHVTGTAIISESDLRSSFPVLDGVVPVSSSGGELTLRGTATLFGVGATVDATVRPENGALVVSPDLPLGGLATITLFSSPAIEVEGVSATAAPGGFALTATGRLR